jgi:secretion/DNA translocation related TadE-like protein
MTDRQRGSATLWVLGMICLVAVVTATCVGIGIVTLARHRAATAADEMALAVAGHALEGESAACAIGGHIARRDGATPAGCALHDAIATVRVFVRLPGALRRFGPAMGTARAGPASAGD